MAMATAMADQSEARRPLTSHRGAPGGGALTMSVGRPRTNHGARPPTNHGARPPTNHGAPSPISPKKHKAAANHGAADGLPTNHGPRPPTNQGLRPLANHDGRLTTPGGKGMVVPVIVDASGAARP
eukprot:9360315-Pyramimonas_sp.AAC.1